MWGETLYTLAHIKSKVWFKMEVFLSSLSLFPLSHLPGICTGWYYVKIAAMHVEYVDLNWTQL